MNFAILLRTPFLYNTTSYLLLLGANGLNYDVSYVFTLDISNQLSNDLMIYKSLKC